MNEYYILIDKIKQVTYCAPGGRKDVEDHAEYGMKCEVRTGTRVITEIKNKNND